MSRPVIGFAGMTHLGLNSAVASAERGFEVICFDPDLARIDALNDGRLPVVTASDRGAHCQGASRAGQFAAASAGIVEGTSVAARRFPLSQI